MLRIGHRGAAGYKTENTLDAFVHGLSLGCDMLEMDIRCCQSGEIIVFHDANIERLTGTDAYVCDLPLEELRGIPLTCGGRIPTLTEALDTIDAQAIACIEIKEQGMAPQLAKLLHQAVATGPWSWETLYAISFFHHELVELRNLCPQLRIGPILVGIPEELAQFAADINAYAMHPSIHFLDEPFIADARKRGIKTYTWTANEPEDIEKALALGVDGITSDYPDRVPT